MEIVKGCIYVNFSGAGFPQPIRILLQKVEEADDPIARFIQLGNLFEVVLRYLASLTLGSLFQIRESRTIEIPGRILSGLIRPSIGHWCQLLHALPGRLAETGILKIPEIVSFIDAREQPEALIKGFREIQFFLGKKNEGVPRRFSLGGFADLLVALRNKTKAHGAIQSTLAHELNPLLETSIKAFIEEMPFLSHYGLGVVQASSSPSLMAVPTFDPACPQQGRLFVLGPTGIPLFSLYPVAMWMENDFWFLNGWESPLSVEYLSYSSGRIHRNSCEKIDLFQEPKPLEKASFAALSMRVEVVRKEAWDLKVDVAIMAQDRHRVFGPVQEIQTPLDPKSKICKVIDELEEQEPDENPGDIILSHRPWCFARYLLEAIIYDFDHPVITDLKTIESGLENALVLAGDLGPNSLSLSPLGTEYGILPIADFVSLLRKFWKKHAHALRTVDLLIITPREESQVKPLQKALNLHFNVLPW